MDWRISIVLSALICLPAGGAETGAFDSETAWGTIRKDPHGREIYYLEVRKWPEDSQLSVPTPFAHIVRGTTDDADGRRGVDFQFNRDATSLSLLLPKPSDQRKVRSVHLEASEGSQQLPDGRIVFSAADARVEGDTAKLESHPGNHRIGFWTDAKDQIIWNFDATRWGMYDVLLTYSNASPDGSSVEVQISGKSEEMTVQGTLKSTGSWYRYTTIDLGRIYLASSGQHTLNVKCVEQVGSAVMNLKAVILKPACEGRSPMQADDGVVTLHGRDATIRGTMLRWEPAEKKQTIGFWVKPTDEARWSFTLNQPGKYDVEVWQGCGSGQGGSKMMIGAQQQTIHWQVEATGHFQNFKPRIVGRLSFPAAGQQQLFVVPTGIAKNAACDIRQIRLIPVANNGT